VQALGTGRTGGAVLQHWQIMSGAQTRPNQAAAASQMRWGADEEAKLREMILQRTPRCLSGYD